MLSEDADPYFTSLCSTKTLQSSSKGFFLDFADHVTETAGSNWLTDTFGKLNSDKARINACYSDPKVGAVVRGTLENVRELYRPKSAPVSRQRRLEGDCAWISGDPHRALALYNQSVMRAPTRGVDVTVDEGLSLAEALACRSEALQALGKTEQSIADIQLAVTQGYPEHERSLLYERMAECYKELGQPSEAKLSFQLATKFLNKNQNGHEKNKIKELQEKMKSVDSVAKRKEETKIKEAKRELLPGLTAGSKPELPNASSRMKLTRSKTAGRFAVAAENIETGDTLIAEPAYAACLLPDFFGSHCHHCFNRLDVPVGCPECSGLAFCSLQCRDQALDTYHNYECKIMDMLIGSGMSILCHLALRMVTQSSLKHLVDLRSTLSCQGINAVHDSSYASVYNLVTHAERRPCEEFLHRTLMALFLLKCLQRSKYFPNPTADNKDKLSKDELYIASLILRHLQLLQFNAHEIYETRLAEDNLIKGSKVVYIGVGIYPTVSLLNHDCHPAVTRYFVGRSIVIKAIRPLSAGDMVAENYGPIFTKRTLALRQRSLNSRYWFKCCCRACKEDWPTFEEMQGNMLRIRCPTADCTHLFSKTPEVDDKTAANTVKCPKCKKQVSLSNQMQSYYLNKLNYDQGFDLMEARSPDLATAKLCQYLDKFDTIASPPFKEYHLSQVMLGSCLSLRGNIWVVPSAGKNVVVAKSNDI